MMHKMMEDYVDDTLVKSTKCNSHLQDLGPILDHMEKFRLRLNPKKCVVEITFREILGYNVSAKGIEVDRDKVQEIMDIPPPDNNS